MTKGIRPANITGKIIFTSKDAVRPSDLKPTNWRKPSCR